MVKILLYILIVLCIYAFVKSLPELHKEDKEYDKMIGKDDIKRYIENTFGKGKFQIFKSTVGEDGKLSHVIYLPQYEWFKSPEYQWYEVYATNNGYSHSKMEVDF